MNEDDLKTIKSVARQTKYELSTSKGIRNKAIIIDSAVYGAYVRGKESGIAEQKIREDKR